MTGTGPYADLVKQRFTLALKRNGLVRRSLALETALFKPPPASGDQLSFL
jgi:hypothetical protein